MKSMAGIALLSGVLALAGCAAPGAPVGSAAGDTRQEQRREAGPEPAPAVAALQDQAEQASAAGEHERAAALLERALRIEPHNAGLWHNLAIVRYRDGDYRQAESMAQRSLQHVGSNQDLERRNWELIAVSRELAGDTGGARAARDRLATLTAGSER